MPVVKKAKPRKSIIPSEKDVREAGPSSNKSALRTSSDHDPSQLHVFPSSGLAAVVMEENCVEQGM